MLFIEMHLVIKMCIIQLIETTRSPQIDLEVRETSHQKLRFFEHSPIRSICCHSFIPYYAFYRKLTRVFVEYINLANDCLILAKVVLVQQQCLLE